MSKLEKAIEAYTKTPSAETLAEMRAVAFSAITAGELSEEEAQSKMNDALDSAEAGIEAPYSVAQEALNFFREIALGDYDDMDSEELRGIVFDRCREVVGAGVTMEAGQYTFVDRQNTMDEQVLLTLSAQGFFFNGAIPMNDLSERFIMHCNTILHRTYENYYSIGYDAAQGEGLILPDNAIAAVTKLLHVASKSKKRADRDAVKAAKDILLPLTGKK